MESNNVNDLILKANNKAQETDSVASLSDSTSVVSQEGESAFIYEAYNEDTLSKKFFAKKPELITLFGLGEYGKSTFLGSMYHLLRTNQDFCGYSFIDSNTLAGFERKVYLRKVNENGKSDVKRTFRNFGCFLDLILKNVDTNEERTIVISDGPGETYGDCISSDSTTQLQVAVKAANKLVVFVNADLFQYVTKPWKEDLKTLFKRFADNNMLPENAIVYVVFNKIDKLNGFDPKKVEQCKDESLGIIRDYLKVDDDKIFDVNSKGLEIDNIDKGLKNLISSLFTPIVFDKKDYEPIDWVASMIEEARRSMIKEVK